MLNFGEKSDFWVKTEKGNNFKTRLNRDPDHRYNPRDH